MYLSHLIQAMSPLLSKYWWLIGIAISFIQMNLSNKRNSELSFAIFGWKGPLPAYNYSENIKLRYSYFRNLLSGANTLLLLSFLMLLLLSFNHYCYDHHRYYQYDRHSWVRVIIFIYYTFNIIIFIFITYIIVIIIIIMVKKMIMITITTTIIVILSSLL